MNKITTEGPVEQFVATGSPPSAGNGTALWLNSEKRAALFLRTGFSELVMCGVSRKLLQGDFFPFLFLPSKGQEWADDASIESDPGLVYLLCLKLETKWLIWIPDNPLCFRQFKTVVLFVCLFKKKTFRLKPLQPFSFNFSINIEKSPA